MSAPPADAARSRSWPSLRELVSTAGAVEIVAVESSPIGLGTAGEILFLIERAGASRSTFHGERAARLDWLRDQWQHLAAGPDLHLSVGGLYGHGRWLEIRFLIAAIRAPAPRG